MGTLEYEIHARMMTPVLAADVRLRADLSVLNLQLADTELAETQTSANARASLATPGHALIYSAAAEAADGLMGLEHRKVSWGPSLLSPGLRILDAEFQTRKAALLAHYAHLNELKAARRPLYGADLRESVRIVPEDIRMLGAVRSTTFRQADVATLTAASSEEQAKHRQPTDRLVVDVDAAGIAGISGMDDGDEAVLVDGRGRDVHAAPEAVLAADMTLSDFASEIYSTIEGRAAALHPVIEHFVCVAPKARAGTPALYARHIWPSMRRAEARTDFELRTALAPVAQPFYPAHIRTQIYFPDKRLLQYDCGKLQRLAELLRDLKDGGHRVLIFTQVCVCVFVWGVGCGCVCPQRYSSWVRFCLDFAGVKPPPPFLFSPSRR